MKKTKKKIIYRIISLAFASAFLFSQTISLNAASNKKAVTYKHKVIAYETAGKIYDFVSTNNPTENRRALNYLLDSNDAKTININNDIAIDTYLRPGNNTTINAWDHTITSGTGVIINDPKAASYGSFMNLTINGGIWKNSSPEGLQGTMMRIAYATNISINDAIVCCNYNGHSIELISCNNVSVNNCILQAQGTCPKNCVEEQLQIDLSTPKTAPGLYRLDPKFCNGTPSKNIRVTNCTVTGARGICASFPSTEARYRKADNYHSNITIKNCNVTGISAEAIALFNTKSATVTNCRITTKTPLKRDSYSVGLAVVYQKGTSPKANKKNVIYLAHNTVKGGRQGILVYSHTKKRFGKVIIKNNKASARTGKKNAIKCTTGKKNSGKKTILFGNKTKKWNGR